MWARPAVVVGYLGLLLALWRMQGVLTDKEALKYLGCAEQVLQGDLHDLLGNYRHYGAYVLFLLPFVAMGAPTLAVPIQAVLMLLAARALERSVIRAGGSERIGLITAAVLLSALPVQQWVLALYTEALFAALTLLFLDQMLLRERPGRWALPLALALLFTRPVGILVVGPLTVWWLTRGRAPWTTWAGHAAVLALAVLSPTVPGPQLHIILGSEVLCGCGTHPDAALGFTGHSVLETQLHLGATLGPGTLLELWGLRLLSLFTFLRPHYSTAHNLLLAPWLLLPLLAALGLWMQRRTAWVKAVTAVLVVYALLVMFTCDEWSGRFLVPLVGPLLLPAALAIARRVE